ncbi:hypothetical protein GCM10010462_19050 [Microbacterium dextranolyticum]
MAVVASAAALVLCTACSGSSSDSDEARASKVVAGVTAADSRVVSASAKQSVSGFSFGWLIDLVLSGDAPVSSKELSAVLLAARHAGDPDPGHLYLYATDEAGASLDLSTAASELGIRYSTMGDGIGVVRDAIDDALGTGR